MRVVAEEVGEPIERIDTATDAGMAELRALSPIRKVPVAVIGGTTVFDSRAIIDRLFMTHGHGELTPPRNRWHELNLLNAIDGALDAVIQLFYLRRDGVAIDGTPYATRQLERADAIFAWLATQHLSTVQLGLAEISLVCTLDWMDFRQAYPTERASALAAVRVAWSDRPSLVATRPHT